MVIQSLTELRGRAANTPYPAALGGRPHRSFGCAAKRAMYASRRCSLTLCGIDHNPYISVLGLAWFVLDDNFDGLIQLIEKPKQAFGRKAIQVAFHKGRDIRLLDTKQLCCFDLRELSCPDYLADLKSQLRLGQIFFWIGQSNVRKDIAATLFIFNGGRIRGAEIGER